MKYFAYSLAALCSFFSMYGYANVNSVNIQDYLKLAEKKQLAQHKTWQRLLYAEEGVKSEVTYSEYFLASDGHENIRNELQADIQALFLMAEPNQSIRCKFPARSQWLIQQLQIPETALTPVECPEFDQWYQQIHPYKATLIYATDFMGNPSSMFGHTLLRLDPKDQQQLNLISYAINYAATVKGDDNWSYAWKGLTGQYPGEYSLMPYYRKVKEYGDFESRDLWEYELNLTVEETQFLVQHIWEMQKVSFPYYFVSDNCAYRLLGLIDLVRPNLNLKKKFSHAAIPLDSIKAIDHSQLIKETVYRPALETQLLSQVQQHGRHLAKQAHKISELSPLQMAEVVSVYSIKDQAKILEMAYDDLYLQFVARQITQEFAQPRLRQLLSLRSQLPVAKQREAVQRPKTDPMEGHKSRHWSFDAGTVQGDKFLQIGHRQAYHDLKDPQAGFRIGTQLVFLDGAIQWRHDNIKLEHLDILTVNSYNPVTPFKMPLSWGFNLGWQQEALAFGDFSQDQQHGVLAMKAQSGYTLADGQRKHLCFVELQTQLQSSKVLDQGWRVGLGPTFGCQNNWSDSMNSLIQIELPYWEDSHQWNMRLNSTMQYAFNQQNSLKINWEYQQQHSDDWSKLSLGYIHFF